jgi:hypothetical protein
MLAVVISTELRGDQLWLRVLGPPGSGKSTLAEALAPAREYVFPVSSITGLFSGYTGGRGGRKKDASLIPKIRNKTVVVKDGDTLINAPGRDKILAEMRDIYDGTSRVHYRNRVAYDYNDVRSTFVICGTDEMRALNRTFLGERFLDIEILGPEDTRPILKRAFDNTLAKVTEGIGTGGPDRDAIAHDRAIYLARVTMGFIHHLKETLHDKTPPTCDKPTEDRITALGQFLSYMRARVNRESREELSYRPRVELATRLVSQLLKLGICLALVFDKTKLDAEVVRLIRKTVLDTAKGFHYEIAELLFRHRREGLSFKQLSITLGLSESSVKRNCADMLELEIIQRRTRPNKSGQRGRDLHVFHLAPNIRDLWKQALGKR